MVTSAIKKNQTVEILLVDDETKLIRIIEANFEEEIKSKQYKFDWSSNGQDALKKIRNQRFDLLLVDITMPGMNGFEFITELHKLDFSIPVIIITGNEIDLDYCNQGMSLRSYNLIPKPIDFDELKKSITNTLKLEKYYTKLFKNQIRENGNVNANKVLDELEFSNHSMTIYSSIKTLSKEQQYKIGMKIIENIFDYQQMQELQSDLPGLLEIAKEDDEYRKTILNEDAQRLAEGKIPLEILEKSYLELKNDNYTKKSGQKVTYNYLLLRWVTEEKKQDFHQIKKSDWQDTIVREKVIEKIQKREWSDEDKLKILNAISKLEKKKIEQVVQLEDLQFLAPQSLQANNLNSTSQKNARSPKTFKLY